MNADTKQCSKCKEVLPLVSFGKRSKSKDGRFYVCTECRKEYYNNNKTLWQKYQDDNKERLLQYREANKARRREYHIKYYEANKERIRKADKEYSKNFRGEYRKAYYMAHLLESQAWQSLCDAVEKGYVVRQPCRVCGVEQNIDGHHADYSKPLAVVWLCRTHHTRLHGLIRRGFEHDEALSLVTD